MGVPSENPNLAERGLIITDFVDRVGDPVAIVASDGSSHRAEALLAEAMRALLHALTGGRPPSEPVGVTHPAHWRPSQADAFRAALAVHPEFGGSATAVLSSDSFTTLTALQNDPGLPTRGVVALCDFGGTGTSITLADAANGFRPIGPTVRHPDLSGDLIDQALLTRLVADLTTTGSVDLTGTSAIGSLGRLRGQCRASKERLSTSAVTSQVVELPGHRTEVRITRTELDDAIRAPLDDFVDVLQDALQRSGIRPGDLVAVASAGGGARMPIITTTLSEHLRVPVVTSAQPELAAAIGGGLKAVRSAVPEGATSMAPVAAVAPLAASAVPVESGGSASQALAWSDADDIPEPSPADPGLDVSDYGASDYDPYEGAPQPFDPAPQPYDPRPQLEFTEDEADDPAAAAPPWYRRPIAVVAIALVAAVVAIGGATFYVLRNDESPIPGATTAPVTSTTLPPVVDSPAPSEAPPPAESPDQQTVIEQAPPPPAVTVTEEPPPATEVPPPPPSDTPPPPAVTSEAPPAPPASDTPSTQPPVSTQPSQQQGPPKLPYETIPGLPFVPAPFQPPQP